jgi:hypothetical protein
MRETAGIADWLRYWQKSNMPSREIHHACKASETMETPAVSCRFAAANQDLFPECVAEK